MCALISIYCILSDLYPEMFPGRVDSASKLQQVLANCHFAANIWWSCKKCEKSVSFFFSSGQIFTLEMFAGVVCLNCREFNCHFAALSMYSCVFVFVVCDQFFTLDVSKLQGVLGNCHFAALFGYSCVLVFV